MKKNFITNSQYFATQIFVAVSMAATSAWAAELGITKDEIVIGQSLGLQGGKDPFAVAVDQGIRLYLDQTNAAGGVHGRKVLVKMLDDEGKAALAESNARKLIAEGAFILFGSVGGAPSMGVASVANEMQIPFFGPLAGAPALRRPYQNMVFPVRAEHRDEFRAMLAAGKDMGMDTVGFMYADSDGGRQHLANVMVASNEVGMKVVFPMAVKPEMTDAQMDQAVKAMVEKNPQIFIHNGPAKVFQKFVEKCRAAGLKTIFMGVNQGSYQIAKALGPLAQGIRFAQVVPSPWSRKHAISREYQDAARKASPNAELSYGQLEGYMTAKALVLSLKAAGKQPSRTSFVKGIQNASFDLGGVPVRYRKGDHEGSRFVDMSIVSRNDSFIH